MHQQEDDIALIQMVLQGHRSAYGTLVEKYQTYVFTLVMRHVNNREVAEELAQDVFVKAYKYLADFRGHSKFSTWLYTIVHTTCLSHLRKKADAAIFPGDDKMQDIAAYTPASEQASARLEQQQQKQLIAEGINHLSKSDAEVITLFYQGEQSIDEIATITGLTTSNVKVKLMRARQKLKDILEQKYARETIR